MHDPYLKIIDGFNRHKINYAVIGVSGLNYYAKDAREMIITADYDIFVKPYLENVEKAVKILKKIVLIYFMGKQN